jgi:hypothetical protein
LVQNLGPEEGGKKEKEKEFENSTLLADVYFKQNFTIPLYRSMFISNRTSNTKIPKVNRSFSSN